MKYLACLVVPLSLACAPGHNRISPRSWEQANEMLNTMSIHICFAGSHARPSSSTTVRRLRIKVGRSNCFEPDRKPGSCIEPRAGTSVEMWKDYARKNRQSWLIEPFFDSSLNVVLKRHTNLPEADCTAPTINYFSRVGFNLDLPKPQSTSRPSPEKGRCPIGFATGTTLTLRKTETGWEKFGQEFIWIS